MRNIILLLLLKCLYVPAFAQQLYFNHLTVNNGLSQGVNNCIYKDSKGLVWISSFDGLNRFDGMECKKYYAAAGSSQGIRGTLFLNIIEDRSADIWIGSNEGLNYYNRYTDSFYCYKPAAGINTEQFCSPFYIDDKGRVWVQSRFDILVFDPVKKQFTKLGNNIAGGNSIIRTIPQALYQPLKTIIQVSSNTALFRVGNITSTGITWTETVLPLTGTPVNTVLLNGRDAWIGTANGLWRLDIMSPAVSCKKVPSVTYAVSSLHLDQHQVLWIGTAHDGLLKADTAANIIDRYYNDKDNDYSLSGNQVIYIDTDGSGNLWVAVWGKGIDYTNLDKFHFNQYISKAEAVQASTDNFLRSIVEVDNEIWCATQSGGIIILDAGKKIKQVLKQGLPVSVEHLCTDGNMVWAATFAGLYAIDAGSRQVSKIETGLSLHSRQGASQYNFITRLRDSSLLLSSNAGLYRCSGHNGPGQTILLKGIDPGDVYLTTYQDAQGRLYISRAFKGFGIYNLQGDSLVQVKAFPLQSTIKCFSDSPDSVLWIGTTTGLIRFNKETTTISKVYTTSDGLGNQYIYGVLPSANYLWLSSNAGISRLELSSGHVKTFSAADGLQSNEYNTYSFCSAANGELLFGGVNGLNAFFPSGMKTFAAAPEVLLTNIQVNDAAYNSPVNYNVLQSLSFLYRNNTLAFQFTVIDYVNASAAYINYKLEGYDNSWVKAPNKTYIRYVNLPPGNYVLKVQAFNADGVRADKEFSLSLTIWPPWWQTWWFRVLAFLTACSLIALAVRNYLRRRWQKQKIELEKELAVEQERIRMARELHDGLGSMLSGIKHSFSAIKNKVQMDDAQQHQFDYTIDKLDDSIRDLRAVSHTMFSAELLEEGLEAAIKNYCNAISVTAKIPVAFENIYQQPAALKGEQAFHIFRVVQELIQNVIKHAHATEALVQLSYNNGMLSLTVEDNGTGFDVEKAGYKEGIGLKNVESRVKLLHGRMDIQAQKDKGTSVFIEVPVSL